MDEIDELIEQAHARGLKIVLDLVLNHTRYVWLNLLYI